MEYNVLSYGAVGDGAVLDTKAIQQAIDRCVHYFIYAKGGENIRITGFGTIDGSEERYYGVQGRYHISGCSLVSTSSAIKIGTESEDDFEHVIIENCHISRSNRGLSFQLRDKGSIRDVWISNLNIETRSFSKEWWGRAEPIYITVCDRKEGVRAGRIEHVRLQNISCHSESGIFIYGSEGHEIKDLELRDIHVVMEKQSKWPCDSYDLRPCEGEGIRPSELYGLYAEGTQNLKLSGITIECRESMREYVGGERKIL